LDTFPDGQRTAGGNTDNRANSAQFQLKLPAGAELGKNRGIPKTQLGFSLDQQEMARQGMMLLQFVKPQHYWDEAYSTLRFLILI
jgi:hypothetical protein